MAEEQKKITLPKKKRVPLSGADRDILAVRRKDPNFHYRWVNIVDDRIQRFKDAGYEPVSKDEVGNIGDTRVDSSEGTSSIVEKGVGAGRKAILMKQLKEHYDEDQAAKQRRVNEIEASMKREAKKDRYGKFEISQGPLGQG